MSQKGSRPTEGAAIDNAGGVCYDQSDCTIIGDGDQSKPDHSQVRAYLRMQREPFSAEWWSGALELFGLAILALQAGAVDLARAHLRVLDGELLKVSPSYLAGIEARRMFWQLMGHGGGAA